MTPTARTGHRRFSCFLALAPLLVLVAVAAGCDIPMSQATSKYDEVFTTGPAPKIVVETFNGSIDISNGMDNEVVTEVTAHASGFDERKAAENLARIEVQITQVSQDEVHVQVKRIGSSFGNLGADVVIAAPPKSVLELKSSNGHVVAEGMQGELKAETSNARVEVVEATGKINVETSNGPVTIEANDAQVDAQSSNAGIRFRGTLAAGRHEMETSNGPIDVRLPASSQFQFTAETSNGGVDVEFPCTAEKSRRRSKKSGTVGDDPQFKLQLETSNSSIDIRKDD